MTKDLKYSKLDKSRFKWGYIMVAPTMLGLLILNLWPLMQSFWLSLNKNLGFNNYKYIGSDNYIKMFSDSTIWQAIGNTLVFTIITVPLAVFISLILASLVNSKIKGKGIYRTIYFLPMVVAPAAIAMVWKWMFNADYGIINYLLGTLGIDPVRWLTNPSTALLSVSIVAIWGQLGYRMIILMAGLNSIPNSYYEAAQIDGASAIKQFRHITLPLVSPTLFFVVITGFMNAIKQFDIVYMMIEDVNPALQHAQTILYLYFEEAFVKNNKGYASAIVMFTFVIIMIITGIQFVLQKKWVHYE
ncbi:carbohydrate ABC transporter permease [Vallitalea okinawensis]|uniref:carbohydrate ABC transporter permease n=1 Tax=Vallitalea okinawensis TaxID=2078660 RepID=UPI000CFD0B9C|nr:sugar ABC transporter permease [Vallitalea okinawensis]